MPKRRSSAAKVAEVAPRKGARSRADVTPEVLAAMNRGEIETITLPEFLLVDFATLLSAIAPDLSKSAESLRPITSVVKRMQAAGDLLHREQGPKSFDVWKVHHSDVVRGWAAYQLAATPKLSLKQRFARMMPLADDRHFGVREWAWMALRPHAASELENAIHLLLPWTKHKSANIRRYAIEILRPRGVWCSHIERLKVEPEMALTILENVKSDPSKYVQDSCANWLNDAAKSQPQFVKMVTAKWRKASRTKETERICKRALRSLACTTFASKPASPIPAGS